MTSLLSKEKKSFQEKQIDILLKELKEAKEFIKKYQEAVKNGNSVGDFLNLSSKHVYNASQVIDMLSKFRA